MSIHRKHLFTIAAAAVVLFVVSNPLGDSQHGLGRHHRLAADVGQTLFVSSLLVAIMLIVLSLVALVQAGRRRASARRP